MRDEGFTPGENSYVFSLREACNRGAYEEAFGTVQEMSADGVKPRLRSYAPILQGACHEVGRPGERHCRKFVEGW